MVITEESGGGDKYHVYFNTTMLLSCHEAASVDLDGKAHMFIITRIATLLRHDSCTAANACSPTLPSPDFASRLFLVRFQPSIHPPIPGIEMLGQQT
jgi:hypothetical protein